jgi:hypothetical protein
MVAAGVRDSKTPQRVLVSHTGLCSAAPGVVCTGDEKRTRSRVLQAEVSHGRFFRYAGFGSKGAAGRPSLGVAHVPAKARSGL